MDRLSVKSSRLWRGLRFLDSGFGSLRFRNPKEAFFAEVSLCSSQGQSELKLCPSASSAHWDEPSLSENRAPNNIKLER